MSYNLSIGEQIKKLRTEQNYTLQQLSEASDLSIGFLSQLERGMSTVAVDVLANLARILGTDLTSFFSQSPRETDNPVMKSFEQECIVVNEHIVQYLLGNDLESFHILPRLFQLMPFQSLDDPNPGLYHHEGEEFVYVLEGILTFFYDGLEYTLYPGDSILIHSFLDHNWINFTNKLVRFISINTPNPYQKIGEPLAYQDLKNLRPNNDIPVMEADPKQNGK